MINASYAPTYLIRMSAVHDTMNSIRKTFADSIVIGTSLSGPYMSGPYTSKHYMSVEACVFVCLFTRDSKIVLIICL